MTTVCCVCQQQTPNETERKNIFKDDLVIRLNSDQKEGTKELEKIRLHSGIELITGYKIHETGKLSPILCKQCFRKLEDFMNFRTQLLSSFGKVIHGQSSTSIKSTFFGAEAKERRFFSKDNDLENLIETSDCPKLSNSQLASDDLINVDENSTSLDFDTFRNNENVSNNSTIWNALKDRTKNNNLVDSDSSNDNIDVQNCDSPVKDANNDIESEIDVCSGEDDEVLEIESERSKVNVKEGEISSDSEIEVCDYEPAGKRMRSFNGISQLLTF